jgi:S-formylglutathione hydrolase FrmB
VLYLLHGNGQHADSFLELGVQSTLDSLIGGHAIGPLIAVMINGGPGTNNWRGRYTSYVFEVQALVDRMLPTLAQRSGRAIAGFSMGGYGALDLALTRPGTFAVAESWLGFFDGLHPAGLGGLRAFLWGASGDPIANPSENAAFAAQLRAAGADARSAVYSGSHDFTTLRAHLVRMLTFAGDGLSPAR